MTATTPVERVASVLERAGFTRRPKPLTVAGHEFDPPAAFLGQEPSPDLVIVGDTTMQTVRGLQQTVEGIGRALDAVRSRRPLTLIVVGPRPDSAALSALSKFARVLPVGEVADEASLSNWLAVLLPLDLPATEEVRSGTASLDTLRSIEDPLAHQLIDLSPMGEAAVAERFHELVDEPFQDLDEESQ